MEAGTLPLAAHADWSIDPRKRWVAIARPDQSRWRIQPPEPVGDVTTFLGRLRHMAAGAPVALGLDVPIGVPRPYAASRPDVDFPAFLRRTRDLPDFYTVCPTIEDITPDRPFYPARGIAGMTRAAHAAALGLGGGGPALSRTCDRATIERPAGAPVFWTLGANQSGKAAIAAWRDLLLPALDDPTHPVHLWPFDGPYRSLLHPGSTAIAETYPAEALRHLGMRLKGSKRRQADRAAAAEPLRDAMHRLDVIPDDPMIALMKNGFGPDAAGEDRFDCTLGVLCVINVVAGNRPDTAPDDPWLHRWEGWVLGQTALPLNRETTPAAPARTPRTRRPA